MKLLQEEGVLGDTRNTERIADRPNCDDKDIVLNIKPVAITNAGAVYNVSSSIKAGDNGMIKRSIPARMANGLNNTSEFERSNRCTWKEGCEEKVIPLTDDRNVIAASKVFHQVERTEPGAKDDEPG